MSNDPSTDPERRKAKSRSMERRLQIQKDASVEKKEREYKQCPKCGEWVAMNFCFKCKQSV